jgi:negative regulator of sigma-B (phosphoserine phosphatase)
VGALMPWRNQKTPGLEWGVAIAPIKGEERSGDSYIVRTIKDCILIAVIDGVGHGDEAAEASRKAIQVLERTEDTNVITLVRRCHDVLMDTRGVVMSIAMLNVAERSMTWLGVGNVAGHVLRSDPNTMPTREVMLTRGGTVGLRLPMLAASVTELKRGDVLLLATDGLAPGYSNEVRLDAPLQHLADQILKSYSRGTDDALVFVGRFLGPDEANA